MFEPQVFGLQPGSGLAKLASDWQASSLKFGIDTSLDCSTHEYTYLHEYLW